MTNEKEYVGRYLAFAFTNRPNGGMGDCLGGFESQAAAEEMIKRMRPIPVYAHIFDTETRELLDVITLTVIGDSLETLNS